MATFEFDQLASDVTLTIQCPECDEVFETEALCVPSPDWSAETGHDSAQSECYEVNCPGCGREFMITLNNSFYGGDGEIDIDDDCFKGCEEDFDDEGYDYDKVLFDASHAEITQLVDAIDVLKDDDVKEKIYKMHYAKAITNLETYLGDTLKKYVLENDKYLRVFVEKYEPYTKELCHVSDVYRIMDNIKDTVKKTLHEDILYHNLPKLKGIYKDGWVWM